MTAVLSCAEARRARMRALGLLPSAARTPGADPRPAAVAGRLLAVQAQDLPQALWALGLRVLLAQGDEGQEAAAAAAEAVRQALADGSLVRSWPMRGTVHLLAAEDLGWLQDLAGPRALAGWPRRRGVLGLEMADYDRAEELTRALLGGGGRIGRAGLLSFWTENGLELRTGWSYHLVWALCQNGVTVFGPPSPDGRGLDLVLAEEWLPRRAPLERDVALRTLGRRAVAGHGPVTGADLSWWTGLTRRDARLALTLAEEDGLERVVVDGTEHWWDPGSQADDSAGTGRSDGEQLLLLPAFDEHLLGYRDRSLQLDPAHASAVMTSNGIARATAVVGGRVVGVWRQREGRVDVLPGEDAALPPHLLGAPFAQRAEQFDGFRAALPGLG
ncbi:winged helix DNA-binding domain-containing protein [Mycetocola reblochoni]|uniref:Winged helix DNA-binding domain-containing protein n=2 Tax=Mycetocola reblochoni TaxID=331618 RepID=A0A1R4KCC3_9MICO|nr:winged helix DNA-binding domain-containing protein [Mycetocola reblochoni]RLP69264.1 winged helix DNA-binding domain-containing protein [Mycetocola reblochoni]SJN41970.1 hypothetical protein FM119_12980 [Mycetocola reblochoni REB411]